MCNVPKQRRQEVLAPENLTNITIGILSIVFDRKDRSSVNKF